MCTMSIFRGYFEPDIGLLSVYLLSGVESYTLIMSVLLFVFLLDISKDYDC